MTGSVDEYVNLISQPLLFAWPGDISASDDMGSGAFLLYSFIIVIVIVIIIVVLLLLLLWTSYLEGMGALPPYLAGRRAGRQCEACAPPGGFAARPFGGT